MEIDLTPSDLRLQARRVAELAENVRSGAGAQTAPQSSFMTSQAIAGLQAHFDDQDQALAERLSELADAIEASAASYERVEDHNVTEAGSFWSQAKGDQ